MRSEAPFLPGDLAELEERLLSRALGVVAMEDVYDGADDPLAIGMRHDVDNVIEPAVALAEWESDHDYRSTYYILHTSPYWQDKRLLVNSLERIAAAGHEIGFHSNALAEALRTGRDPLAIIEEAVAELRGYGFQVRSTVAHGDGLCRDAGGFVNDEVWAECARPNVGAPDRVLEYQGRRVPIRPVPLSTFDFEFDSIWLRRAAYLSDSGGRWAEPGFEDIADGFPYAGGQLHVLQHPDWWGEAFE